MKYTTMYERYQEVKKKSRVKGSKATATEQKYLFKAVRLFFPLYKEAVKILQAQGGKNPVLKHYGKPGVNGQGTILRNAYVIAKREGK
jgi:hypothetical protein